MSGQGLHRDRQRLQRRGEQQGEHEHGGQPQTGSQGGPRQNGDACPYQRLPRGARRQQRERRRGTVERIIHRRNPILARSWESTSVSSPWLSVSWSAVRVPLDSPPSLRLPLALPLSQTAESNTCTICRCMFPCHEQMSIRAPSTPAVQGLNAR